MSENRLPDYLDHIQQAAADVCSFVDGLGKVSVGLAQRNPTFPPANVGLRDEARSPDLRN